MNLEITSKTENKHIGRTEVKGKLVFDQSATPSNDEVVNTIAAELKSKPELVVMRTITTNFGESTGTFCAHVYSSQEAKDLYVIKTKKQKEAEKKAAEEAKAKAEEEKKAAEEAKAKAEEEKKAAEEAKSEEKPEEKPAESDKSEKQE